MQFVLFESDMIDPPREIVGVKPSKYTSLQKKKAIDWLRKGEHEELVQYYYKLNKMHGKDVDAMKDLVSKVLRDPQRCEYCGHEVSWSDPKCKFCGALKNESKEKRTRIDMQSANEVLSEAIVMLLEKVKCDRGCMEKYKNLKTGRFLGGKGERFNNCVKAFKECCSGVKSPEGVCASIARAKGLAPGS